MKPNKQNVELSTDDLATGEIDWGDEIVNKPYVVDQLESKARLYEERNKIYGDNYKIFGPVFSVMMRNQNLHVRSGRDMNRLGILVQIVAKITRYCENFDRGGHADSLDDIAVYAMMLKELETYGEADV